MKEAFLEDFVEWANNIVDGDVLHLATALHPQREDLEVNNKSGREAQAEIRAGLAERGGGCCQRHG